MPDSSSCSQKCVKPASFWSKGVPVVGYLHENIEAKYKCGQIKCIECVSKYGGNSIIPLKY